MNIEEFEISVPWGNIAVKTWGNQINKHIITTHGFLDNAGSFDNLIPLLPQCFYYICLDFPGHGRSSAICTHSPYHAEEALLSLKKVVEYFNVPKYIFLGHSYGAACGFLFAQLYPETVEKLILLDTTNLFTKETETVANDLKLLHTSYLQLMEKTSMAEYDWDEAVNKFIRLRMFADEMSLEGARAIVNRQRLQENLKSDANSHCSLFDPQIDSKKITSKNNELQSKKLINDKIRLIGDVRMKAVFLPLTDNRYFRELFEVNAVKCPILVIFGKHSIYYNTFYKKFTNKLRSYKNVKIIFVDGNHSVHITKPENVASHISKFLLKHVHKL